SARRSASRRRPEPVRAERDRGLLPSAVAHPHGSLGLAGVLALTQRLALVELALALGQCDLDLGAPVGEVQLQRDQRVPAGRDGMLELADLLAVQQQL